MSDKRNPHIERYTRRYNVKIMITFLYVAFFFAAATLLVLYFFDDFLVTQAAKPENSIWLTEQVQFQLKFAFRCLGELFFVLSFSSLSIPFFYMTYGLICKYKQQIKSKFSKTLS